MEHLINIINHYMPDALTSLTATFSTTPGHLILFILLILSVVLLGYLFRGPLRNYVQMELYRRRRRPVFRLLFHRLENVVKPFRLIISLFIVENAVTLFVVGEQLDLVFYLAYLFLFAWWFYEILKFFLDMLLSLRIQKQQEVRGELFNLFLNIIKVVAGLVIILIVLSKFGVNVTGLITSLGVGGIVIGLSAKDTLTNFFDSIRLVGENAFQSGDWIETDEIEGFVTEVGLAATRIRTFDNALVTVPNSKLASGYIKNWSKRIIGRRIKFRLRLAYTYDTREIDRVLYEIREMVSQHSDVVNDNKLTYLNRMKQTVENGLFNAKDTLGVRSTLLVYLDEINEYSMDILVYAFSISVNWEEWLRVKQDILQKSIEIIDRSDLELALPHEEITLKDKKEKKY